MSDTRTVIGNQATASGWNVFVNTPGRLVASRRDAAGWITVAVSFSVAGTVTKAFRNGAQMLGAGRRAQVLAALTA